MTSQHVPSTLIRGYDYNDTDTVTKFEEHIICSNKKELLLHNYTYQSLYSYVVILYSLLKWSLTSNEFDS